MSNFYHAWKWNHFIGHQLQVNIKKKKLTFSLRYFCFSVNNLNLTELENCLKNLSKLTLNEVNVSH